MAGFAPEHNPILDKRMSANSEYGNQREEKMNFKKLMSLAVSLAIPISMILAQGDEPKGPGPGGPGPYPPPPIIAVLDLNHDGTISAEEIGKAPESLLKLDMNGDGQLTHEELHPPGRGSGPDDQGGSKQGAPQPGPGGGPGRP